MATEYIYPESPDDISTSQWSSTGADKYTEIDDIQGSPDDGDYIYVVGGNDGFENDGTIQNFTGTGSDNINWVKYWFRGQESGGETVRAGVFDGSNHDTIDLVQASWTTTSHQMNLAPDGGAWSAAKINALRWYVITIRAGKDTSVEWRVSQFYLEVDYTPITTRPQVIMIT